MYSVLISIAALVLGYLLYGRFVEKIFQPKMRKTPAYVKYDGVDFLPMPNWKVFMIQFLNIAGTGPIFGAIMGAKFGPSCYLWIVFGCIFGGAVHDYLSGMISIRRGGCSLPEMIGHYLGKGLKKLLLVFTLLLLLLVTAVFVYSPAIILDGMIGGQGTLRSLMPWIIGIFAYYLVASLIPIDKLIGKIYPVFAVALIFMAIALMVCLLIKWPSIPEVWDGLQNRGPSLGMNGQDIFPCLFITIACGAISGFHSTQSPLMARCLKSEKLGRPIFFGSMITEGIVAIIWAAVASYVFYDGGYNEIGCALNASAPEIVNKISITWLGTFGGILAIMGVVAAPLTTGDTAMRSARLIISDALNIKQDKIKNRLLICLPLFFITAGLLAFNISDSNGFNRIWRYFGWANQTLALFTLWMGTVYLLSEKRNLYYLITEIPAVFMTVTVFSFLSKEFIGLNMTVSLSIGFFFALLFMSIFHYKARKKAIAAMKREMKKDVRKD